MPEQFPDFHGDKSPRVLKVGPKVALRRFLSNYAKFSGRATRSEYWWIALFFLLLFLAVQLMGLVSSDPAPTFYHHGGAGLASMIGILALIVASVVPIVSLSVRRLHDSNNSGWLYLLNLIPLIGQIMLVIFLALPSKATGTRFDRQAS